MLSKINKIKYNNNEMKNIVKYKIRMNLILLKLV